MKTRTNTALLPGLAALTLAASNGPALAAETSIRLTTGLEYSTGTYGGTEDIEELYVPLTLNLNTNRIGASLSVPFLGVRAPAGTVTDSQAVPGEGDITTESGLGDITANFTVYDVFYSASLDLALDVTGAIKFGTADPDRGMGTGENDYSLYLEGYKWFDAFTLFGSAGHRLRGEPDGIDLNDVLLASLGGSWPAGRDSTVGIVFDFRESALEGYDDIQELTAFGSIALNEHWYLQLYAFAGLTDSATDWGGGFTLTTSVKRPAPRESF